MKICPRCGEIVDFNTYFGAYICSNCSWIDDSYNKERIEFLKNMFSTPQKPVTISTKKIKLARNI